MLAQAISPAQMQILEMTSFVKSDEMVSELKKAIAAFFSKMMQVEVDRLWETGELNEEKVESFRTLHERTPYRQ